MTSEKTGPRVYWLNDAQQNLQEALARELSTAPDEQPLRKHIEEVNKRLQQTFDGSEAVIVRQRFCGYSLKSNQDVLLVEVIPPNSVPEAAHDDAESRLQRGDAATYIVKLADDPQTLRPELEAWQRCRPAGFRRDAHLASLEPGPADDDGVPISLLYEDATSVLGTGQIQTLEDAFLDSVRFGLPRVESITSVLRRMYESLGRRFYTRSFVVEADELFAEGSDFRRRVADSLTLWKDTATAVVPSGGSRLRDELRLQRRRETLGLLAERRESFLDPCDYLEQVLSENSSRTALCPRVLKGCAHGDLHGRNMLVSLANDDVDSLVVFDYEDFRRHNVVGWDFVKLETELKARAYPHVFDRTVRPDSGEPWVQFVEGVHQFELALDSRSEQAEQFARCQHPLQTPGTTTADPMPGGPMGERLARIMLAIRAAAKQHLGVRRNRPHEWLEEYRFLLACYGTYAAKFGNYNDRELMAAYISAGTAIRALGYPRQMLEVLIDDARRNGETLMRAGRREAGDAADPVAFWDGRESKDPQITYQIPLEYARVLSRSDVARNRGQVEKAICFLETLRARYPHCIEIDEEISLTCMELSGDCVAKADACLARVTGRNQVLPEETLCRVGRRYKTMGEQRLVDGSVPKEAEQLFRRALQYYEHAYRMRGSFYPGINVASLLYVLRQSRASDVAEEVLARIHEEQFETMWAYATRAEANFIMGHHDIAQHDYESAISHPHCQPQNRRSMLRQLELLVRVSKAEIQAVWDEKRIKSIFQTGSSDEASEGI